MIDFLKVISDSTIANRIIEHSNDTLVKIIYLQNNSNGNSIFNWAVLIPLIAVIAGGIITLFQVRGNTISNARITWIENFRISVSEYCDEIELVIICLRNMFDEAKGKNKKELEEYFKSGMKNHYEKYSIFRSESNKLRNKILLYLNSEEDLHKKIEITINNIESIVDSDEILKIDLKKIHEEIDSVITSSKIVIKNEWEKAKTYKPEWFRKFIKDMHNQFKKL